MYLNWEKSLRLKTDFVKPEAYQLDKKMMTELKHYSQTRIYSFFLDVSVEKIYIINTFQFFFVIQSEITLSSSKYCKSK